MSSYYPPTHLTSKKTIRAICRKYDFLPSKRLGQNFLIDKRVVKKLISTGELQLTDLILEIGPGIGNLTQELAKKAKKVVAVEKDPQMIAMLKETLEGFQNVKVIQGDILKLDLNQYTLQPYKVIANLPFYLTAPLIRKFLENRNPPQLMALIIQKEVAQRICGKPPKMNLLAVSIQFYAKAKIISYVSKKSFWPQPRVSTAIIKLVPTKNLNNYPANKLFRQRFFKVVRSGFSQPRKQLANNLSQQLKLDKDKVRSWLLKNKIRPEQRAETLTLNDWINLAKTFNDKK